MTLLLLGCALFFGTHLVPNIGNVRENLQRALSEKGYLSLYSVLSLAGFVMMFMGRSQAGFESVWVPPVATTYVAFVIMFVALYSFLCMFLDANLKRIIKHPMLMFFTLWGVAHLLSNGDLASIIFFGSIVVFAIFKIISLSKRQPAVAFEKVSVVNDVIVLALTIVVFGAGISLHPYLLGGAALL